MNTPRAGAVRVDCIAAWEAVIEQGGEIIN
jgi:hypothetical protein